MGREKQVGPTTSVRVVDKDIIRFRAASDGAPVEIEIRVRQHAFGWQSTAVLHDGSGAAPVGLGRIFRARDRRLSADKMVTWVRRRYAGAQPVAERAPAPGDR